MFNFKRCCCNIFSLIVELCWFSTDRQNSHAKVLSTLWLGFAWTSSSGHYFSDCSCRQVFCIPFTVTACLKSPPNFKSCPPPPFIPKHCLCRMQLWINNANHLPPQSWNVRTVLQYRAGWLTRLAALSVDCSFLPSLVCTRHCGTLVWKEGGAP